MRMSYFTIECGVSFFNFPQNWFFLWGCPLLTNFSRWTYIKFPTLIADNKFQQVNLHKISYTDNMIPEISLFGHFHELIAFQCIRKILWYILLFWLASSAVMVVWWKWWQADYTHSLMWVPEVEVSLCVIAAIHISFSCFLRAEWE